MQPYFFPLLILHFFPFLGKFELFLLLVTRDVLELATLRYIKYVGTQVALSQNDLLGQNMTTDFRQKCFLKARTCSLQVK